MLYILLILIFIRPFISSLAFFYLDFLHYFILIALFSVWFLRYGLPLNETKGARFPFILFALSIIISVIFSQNKFISAGQIYKYICYLSLFVIVSSLSCENKNRIIYTIILAGFIISLLAIYQYFFGFKHVLNYITKQKIAITYFSSFEYINQRRAFFPFVTPNALAGFLILIIPLALSLQSRTKWIVTPCLFLALLFTKSLGAFLSLIFGMILFLFLRKKPARTEILLLLILGLCSIIIFVLRQSVTKEYLLPAFSLERRLTYWQNTIKLIKLYPLFGVGIGNFNLRFSRYAHNVCLQIWAEMGILGIVSFLWLIIGVIKSAYNNIKTSSHQNYIYPLLTSVIIFLLHNLFDFTFFLPEISLIWWLILGMAQ